MRRAWLMLVFVGCYGPGETCDPNATVASCPDGYTCMGTCVCTNPRAVRDVGEACAGDCEICRTSLVCNSARDLNECQEPGSQGEGDRCGGDGNCAAPLVCNEAPFTERCEAAGIRGEEAPCGAWDNCTADLTCDLDRNRCVPLLGENEECHTVMDCQSGLTCNYGVEPQRCFPPQGPTGPCALDVDCEAGLTCSDALMCE